MLYAYKILTGKEKIKKIDFINGIDPTRYVVTNTGYVIDDKRGVLKTAKSVNGIPVMSNAVYLCTVDNKYVECSTAYIVAKAFIPVPKYISEKYLIAHVKSCNEQECYNVNNICWDIDYSYFIDDKSLLTKTCLLISADELPDIIAAIKTSFNNGEFNMSHIANKLNCSRSKVLTILHCKKLHPELDKLREMYMMNRRACGVRYSFTIPEIEEMCKSLANNEKISDAIREVNEKGISVSFKYMSLLRKKIICTDISDNFFGYENAYNPPIEEYDDITGDKLMEYASLEELSYVSCLRRDLIYSHIIHKYPYNGVIWVIKDNE